MKSNNEPITKVIFRKWPRKTGGDVIALFPAIAGTYDLWTCSSYQHIGQHGAATVMLSRCTKPAKPSEYADLKEELERIGYRLKVVKRFTRADLEARREQVK